MEASMVMLFKPWLTLAVFAMLVIPAKLVILRIVPPTWRTILESRVEPWKMWTIWVMVWALILYAAR